MLNQFSQEQQNAGPIDGLNWIGGRWEAGQGFSAEDQTLGSVSPCERFQIWRGEVGSVNQVEQAVNAARGAFGPWQRLGFSQRLAYVRAFEQTVRDNMPALTYLIARETGKPLWEAATESASVAGKVGLSIDALQQRRDTVSENSGDARAVTRFKPHGVLAVLGPFNFPAHLPNGHIVPALLAGNTVVFKPSELTPAVGQFLAAAWSASGLPAGVLNLVHGGRNTGAALVSHPQIDGLLFTGSSRAGQAFHQQMAGCPEKILALEMGGNNALVVDQVDDVDAAVYQIMLSAYLTAGQRCTCARRLIVIQNRHSDALLGALQQRVAQLSVGCFDQQPEPFLGPVISAGAGQQLQAAWQTLQDLGGTVLNPLQKISSFDSLLSPALIDMTEAQPPVDEEWFGPMLQIFRVPDLATAIEKANQTRYGLSAGLLSQSRAHWEQFISEIRAGVVNWNRQTTGASGRLPFGGCGLSGNHRPSGFYAADYCSFPVASIESDRLELPVQKMPGINWD